jgi:hypothetical protein
MRRRNFALRAPPELLAEARECGESEGLALNQLKAYFEERAPLGYFDFATPGC